MSTRARIISWSYWCTDSIKDRKDGSNCQRWRWSNGVQVVRSLGEEEGKSWQLDPLVILARPLGSAWQCQRHPRLTVSCLKTKGVLRRCSQDQRRFQTYYVWRHFSSEDASPKAYYVWKHSSRDSLCLDSLHFSAQNTLDFFKVHFVNMYRVSIRSCFCYPIHVF